MIEDRSNLESELLKLKQMLAGVPGEAILDRASLESRIVQVEQELDTLPLATIKPRATLTFRGKPVRGSHGISAEFGSKAAKGFSDAYSAVVAGVKENLRYMGPIPERAGHELLIVGTAVGSFGFQFELPQVEPDLIADGATLEQAAVEQIRSLLEVSATGSDEEISDIVDEIHPRAVKKIAEFLNLLSKNNAMCGLEVAERHFKFKDSEQLKRSAERLADENIRETDATFEGAFIGVLPKSRNFEFSVAKSGEVLRGRVSSDIEDADVINEYIGRLVNVQLASIQVGQGRPRYTLMSIDKIKT